VNVIVK